MWPAYSLGHFGEAKLNKGFQKMLIFAFEANSVPVTWTDLPKLHFFRNLAHWAGQKFFRPHDNQNNILIACTMYPTLIQVCNNAKTPICFIPQFCFCPKIKNLMHEILNCFHIKTCSMPSFPCFDHSKSVNQILGLVEMNISIYLLNMLSTQQTLELIVWSSNSNVGSNHVVK